MTSSRKVLYVSGTRADYGLMRNVLRSIRDAGLEVELVVTGMHLMKEFGNTAEEVEKGGFRIHRVDAKYDKDDYHSMAKFLGNFVMKLSDILLSVKPDFLLLLGDRAEMLGGAIAGAYMHIPVAHVHGGDVSSTIDDAARHAITKLVHLHFPATERSAERILKMGEEKWRVNVVGAPGLDDLKLSGPCKDEVFREFGLDPAKTTLLVVQHPMSLEKGDAGFQIKETLEAAKEFCEENGGQVVAVYPNADAGGREMIKVIDGYARYSCFKIFKNIPRNDFIRLMANANVMVGNSSSAIIEAPYFHLPVVNVGTRQRGRERSTNIIDVGYSKEGIKSALNKAVSDTKFLAKVMTCKTPYGDGNTGVRIANVLKSIKTDYNLLQKQMTY